MSKLGDYLKKHKIDVRRVVAVSRGLEAFQPEDREIQMARVRAKGGDEKSKDLAAKKSRSGRAVSRVALDNALAGKTISRRSRARVVRAVSALVSKKTKGEAKLEELF